MRPSGPARLALLNLAVRNVTASEEEKAEVAVSVDLSGWASEGNGVKVKRMTAPGLDSKDSGSVTWAGQSYENGMASGVEMIEVSQDGKVTIEGSEAVLVFF